MNSRTLANKARKNRTLVTRPAPPSHERSTRFRPSRNASHLQLTSHPLLATSQSVRQLRSRNRSVTLKEPVTRPRSTSSLNSIWYADAVKAKHRRNQVPQTSNISLFWNLFSLEVIHYNYDWSHWSPPEFLLEIGPAQSHHKTSTKMSQLKGLNVVSWNARGITNSSSYQLDLKNYVFLHRPDIVLLQETFLSSSHKFFVNWYISVRNDRDRHGGGTGTWYSYHDSQQN